MKNVITNELIRNSYTYPDYIRLIEELLAEGKTTGPDQTLEMIELTKLNILRMKRITKNARIDEQLKKSLLGIGHSNTWLVIAEAWCGDGAQIIPYINAMAELNPKIRLRIILRDEHPEVMNEFLTEGKRSIPVFISLDEELHVMATWGPRPVHAKNIFYAYKNDMNMTKEDFHRELHLWYAKDQGKAVMNEISELLKNTRLAHV
jgi:hypothetical protein